MTDRIKLFAEFLTRLSQLEPAKFVAPHWATRCEMLKQFALTRPLEWFLVWSNDVDIEEYDGSFDGWLSIMKDDRQWDRWHRLTRKSPVATHHALASDPGASPITVQHAFHLHTYEKWTGDRFLDGVDTVVEVGGGYGNFARMLYADGFTGSYVIIDLPHIREIQRLFLKLRGGDDRIHLFTEKNLPLKFSPEERVAFVATWSLSETPLEFRAKLFPSLYPNCVKYLMASQWNEDWFGIDNMAYFSQLMSDAGGTWIVDPVPMHAHGGQKDDSRYLFGRVQR